MAQDVQTGVEPQQEFTASKMIKAGKLYIPENDPFFSWHFGRTGDRYDDHHLKLAFGYVKDSALAVDVGAHVGSWSRILAKRFSRVLAFEPTALNYACLLKNIEKLPNIQPLHVAVGEKEGMTCVSPSDHNSGQWHVSAENNQTKQVIPMLTLDSLNLQSCGLLKIDIEGFELFALRGAVETIRRCQPVIVIEENGLCERYGHTRETLFGFLTDELGYHCVEEDRYDFIFVPAGTAKIPPPAGLKIIFRWLAGI